MEASYSLLLLLSIVTQPVTCCQFGEGCMYSCHCKDDDVCDPDTGDCPNGCADGAPTGYGWGGPGCQVGNIAYETAASQSATHDDDKENNAARFAVDGDLNQDFPGGSARCAWARAVAEPNSTAWWYVDFEDEYVMYNVTVFNNDHGPDYLDGASIVLGTFDRIEEMGVSTDGRVYVETFKVHPPDIVLRLFSSSADEYLVICEVVVYGFLYRECTHGKFGPGCLLSCQCHNGTCRDTDGYCSSGCAAGKMGDDCQEDCRSGTWGVDCNMYCQCGDEGCTPDKGICLIPGCPLGRSGNECINVVAIMAGSVVSGLVICVIATTIIICRRKSTEKSKKESASNGDQENNMATEAADAVYADIPGDLQEEDNGYLTPVTSPSSDLDTSPRQTDTAGAAIYENQTNTSGAAIYGNQANTTGAAIYENQQQFYINTAITDSAD